MRTYSSAVRVGHPHSGLRQISKNAIYTEKPLSADALIRSAGRSLALGFSANFQKSPNLMRPHWDSVRVNPSALNT